MDDLRAEAQRLARVLTLRLLALESCPSKVHPPPGTRRIPSRCGICGQINQGEEEATKEFFAALDQSRVDLVLAVCSEVKQALEEAKGKTRATDAEIVHRAMGGLLSNAQKTTESN